MARERKNGAATLGFEAKLWAAANALQSHMGAAECEYAVPGLFFLRCNSGPFEGKGAELKSQRGATRRDVHMLDLNLARFGGCP